MPRGPRLDTRNSIYHALTKGNGGSLLFHEHADYTKFSCFLDDARSKDPHFLLAYCLMPNHVHLLVETAEVPLSKIMHRLLLRYSLYFNKRYDRSGHLFQNRFKSRSCRDENYLLQLLVYIHENPHKAGLVENGMTYPYSSERVYEREPCASTPVNSMRALQLIGPSPDTAWKAYHHHLAYVRSRREKTARSPLALMVSEPCFHPDPELYVDCVPTALKGPPADEFDFLKNVPLAQICAAVAHIRGVEEAAVRGTGKARNVTAARRVLIYAASKAGWRSADLEREFGYGPGTIAHHLRRCDENLDPGEQAALLRELRLFLEKGDSKTKEQD